MKTSHLFRISLGIFAAALVFTSCKRDEPTPNPTTARTFTPGEGFFVLDEGGFQAGNASISYYQATGSNAGSTFNNLFSAVNRIPLGDVAQSMTMMNGRLYVVVNNSSKIVVLNPQTLGIVTTITGLSGPRNIVQVDANTAWITQMYDNNIYVLDLNTNTIVGNRIVGVTTEAMCVTAGKIFITSLESDKLYAVTTTPQFSVDSSITIAPGGNSMVVDGNGKLWILAYGYWATSAAGGLYRVNPSTMTLEASMPMTTSDFATHLCANQAGDSLFFLNYNIYRMSVQDAGLPSTPFISGAGHAFYTIGLLPNTSSFFAGDAVDYVQAGLIFKYDGSGAQTDADTVGVIPNSFLMY